MNRPLFGIDLGGTKIEGVVLMPGGQELLRHRVPTPRDDYDATLRAIAGLVGHLEAETGHECPRIGCGIPGSIAPKSGRVRNANATWINGRNLPADLAQALGRPVRCSNDANCLALSECHDGAGAGAASVFAVILGTGVGGGLVIDGRIMHGARGIAGEWGHMPMPGATALGEHCFCGRRGCVETYLSGPALVRAYAAKAGAPVADAREIAVRAGRGDAVAQAVLAEFGDRLGVALGIIVNVLDPETIVLGGGLSNLPGLADQLAACIAPHVFLPPRDQAAVRPVVARWGDSSGVRGAARLWEGSQ